MSAAIRPKYHDVWFRWRPTLPKRRQRRLQEALPCGILVSADGCEGQADKWTDAEELHELAETILRFAPRDVRGAIVARGYGWRTGRGHDQECECPALAARRREDNMFACVVAKHWAASPVFIAFDVDPDGAA